MKFSTETLRELAYQYPGGKVGEIEVVYREHFDSRRWVEVYEQVFKYEGKYYTTSFEEGSTEMQDTRPYDYEPDEIELAEVFPHEVTKIEYRLVPA